MSRLASAHFMTASISECSCCSSLQAEQHVIPAGISDSMRIYGYLGATQELLEQAGEVTDTIIVSLILMATLLDPQPGHLGMRHIKACFTYSILEQIFIGTSRDPLWDWCSCLA